MSSRVSESGAVLAAVKGKSLRDGLRPPLTAAPRSAPEKSGRDEEMSQGRSNKEMLLTTPLTGSAPYKSLGAERPLAERQETGGIADVQARACMRRDRPFEAFAVDRREWEFLRDGFKPAYLFCARSSGRTRRVTAARPLIALANISIPTGAVAGRPGCTREIARERRHSATRSQPRWPVRAARSTCPSSRPRPRISWRRLRRRRRACRFQ